jgi:hypothetical protein
MEHNCKYAEPELHKTEILRVLNITKDGDNDNLVTTVLSKTAVNNNILYSQMIVNRNLIR